MPEGIRTPLFGRSQSGGMFAIDDMSLTTGNRFYVDSGSATASDESGSGLGPDTPFATVDAALGSHITASNGDIIYVNRSPNSFHIVLDFVVDPLVKMPIKYKVDFDFYDINYEGRIQET